nr:MAG TPA: hypothetical protein [Caudoviricetes sp.]
MDRILSSIKPFRYKIPTFIFVFLICFVCLCLYITLQPEKFRYNKRSRLDLNNSKEHIFESHIAQINNVMIHVK